MTIKVNVSHTEEGNTRAIGVQMIEKADSGEINVLPITVLPPGHSSEFYVHSNLEFRVFEINREV